MPRWQLLLFEKRGQASGLSGEKRLLLRSCSRRVIPGAHLEITTTPQAVVLGPAHSPLLKHLGLERRASSQKCLLILERTWFGSIAPMFSGLTTVLRDQVTSSLCAGGAHKLTQLHMVHINKNNTFFFKTKVENLMNKVQTFLF